MGKDTDRKKANTEEFTRSDIPENTKLTIITLTLALETFADFHAKGRGSVLVYNSNQKQQQRQKQTDWFSWVTVQHL